jgi:hypothetical protein
MWSPVPNGNQTLILWSCRLRPKHYRPLANSYKKIQQDAAVYQNFISYLYEAQRVSGDTPPIVRSLKLHTQPLVLHTWRVVGHVFAGCWQRPATTYRYCYLPPSRQVAVTVWKMPAAIAAGSSNGVKNARCCRYRCMCSWWWLEVPLKTCRAVTRFNKLYNVASCWIYIGISRNTLPLHTNCFVGLRLWFLWQWNVVATPIHL